MILRRQPWIRPVRHRQRHRFGDMSSWPSTIRRPRPRSGRPARSSLAITTPEAIGDMSAGSNHVLPTARTAAFLPRVRCPGLHEAHLLLAARRSSLAALADAAVELAETEGSRLNAPRLSAAAPSKGRG